MLVVEILPPWKMYFDGAAHQDGAGAGVVFLTSEGEVLRTSPKKEKSNGGMSTLVVNKVWNPCDAPFSVSLEASQAVRKPISVSCFFDDIVF